MNILVLGSGGREHALCWKIRQSPRVKKLYAAPGNGGTAGCAVNFDLNILDNEAVKDFCIENKINLVVVGPEAPLARGITDKLEDAGVRVFGPSYAAARIESSKIFAKELMGRCGAATASFRIFDSAERAKKYVLGVGAPIVIKADGLASGKGVFVAGTVEEACDAIERILVKKEFGSAGNKIIIEEFLEGEEASILVLSDGKRIIPLASSQDHKRIFDGDKGPNTGGMGAYSPAPIVDEALFERIDQEILKPVIDIMRKEEMPYKGVLYAGLMITTDGPKVLEFNARSGDPETQAILPRLKTDIMDILVATSERDLSGFKLDWDDADSVCVVMAAGGYPGDYEKGKEIIGIDEAEKAGALVFHAGTQLKNGKFYTSGGRVLGVAGSGKNIKEAVNKTYGCIKKISFDGMHYRRDIAHRAVKRLEEKEGKK